MTTSNWLLPEHLSDILPAEARRIEELRRAMLDLYRNCGFELVAPPLVEYTESLFVGNSHDLTLQTNKLVDQLSGRTMGVRADMTSQVARIDAHLLNREGVARLCYCGSVLHARPSGLLADRELLQIGAEIYGYAGYEADLQVIELALESLALAGVEDPSLDLNHPGVSRALIEAAGMQDQAAEVLSLLKEKDVPGLRQLLDATRGVPDNIATALIRLPSLYGNAQVLDEAASVLPDLPGIRAALQALRTLVEALQVSAVGIDLADVKGYDYHSGVSFAIFGAGWPEAIVRGGRYDSAATSFGRARAATGFSLDLRKVSAGLAPAEPSRAVRAPWLAEPDLTAKIRQLRQEGHVVVQFFPGTTQSIDEFVFDRELVCDNGQWVLKRTN